MALPSAAVAMIRCRKPHPSILLIERSQNPLDPWSGHLAFPGGGREAPDLDLLDTAIRECEEEIGLRLRRADCCGIRPHAVAGHYSGREVRVAPFLFELEERPDLKLNPEEVHAVIWLEEASFMDAKSHGKSRFHSKFPEVEFSYFLLKGKKLWGFTYEQLVLFFISIKKISK